MICFNFSQLRELLLEGVTDENKELLDVSQTSLLVLTTKGIISILIIIMIIVIKIIIIIIKNCYKCFYLIPINKYTVYRKVIFSGRIATLPVIIVFCSFSKKTSYILFESYTSFSMDEIIIQFQCLLVPTLVMLKGALLSPVLNPAHINILK